MHVVLITGAPCVGKSAVGEALVSKLRTRSAFVDGDWLGCYLPHDFVDNRERLIQANIRACTANYARAGAEYLIAAYVFWDVDDFKALLQEDGYDVHIVGLTADRDCLRARHKKKYGKLDDEYLGVMCNVDTRSRKLDCTFRIDTTDMSVEEVAAHIAQELLRMG